MPERKDLGSTGYYFFANTDSRVALVEKVSGQGVCNCDGSERALDACDRQTASLEQMGHGSIVDARKACRSGCRDLMAKLKPAAQTTGNDGGPWMGR